MTDLIWWRFTYTKTLWRRSHTHFARARIPCIWDEWGVLKLNFSFAAKHAVMFVTRDECLWTIRGYILFLNEGNTYIKLSWPDPGQWVMQCKHFPLTNHSAFSKHLKQYSEPHNEASFHTDSRDSSGEGWCSTRQHTIETPPIDIYSFLHGLLCQESCHSPRDLGSAHACCKWILLKVCCQMDICIGCCELHFIVNIFPFFAWLI